MENPVTYAKHHKFIMGFLVFAVVFVTAIGARVYNRKAPAVQTNNLSKVGLINVNDYLKDRGTITANGTVESLDQADLRSQASGQVVSVPARIGQKVVRGQVLVSLQQSDAAAALAQAKAVLKAQQARLDEMKKGARSEQIDLAKTALEAAKQTLADTKTTQDSIVANAYSNLLNAGLSIVPNERNTSKAVLSLSGSYLLNKEGVYTIQLTMGGDKLPFNVTGIETYSDWITRGTAAPIGKGGLFLNISGTGDIFPGDVWTVTIPNTQSPMYAAAKNGYETAQKARDAAVNGATNALAAAQDQYNLTMAGATSEQIKAQEAAVEQASASVQSMLSLLDKTVIRSPIDGVVAAINVKYGELVSPGSLVARVVSNGGLEIKTFISESDLPYVKEGAEVQIGDNAKGKVWSLAPSIDVNTKNIEATVLVEDYKKSGLIVGQNAVMKIAVGSASKTTYLLPIQTVQISNDGSFVFTVDASSTLRTASVKLGKVIGEMVEVTEGLKPDMKIVSAVYDLKEGQKVVTE